jgi:hypothetical protein
MILGEKRPIRAQAGQERAVVKFAWRRTWLSDGRRIWLERYVEIQRVMVSSYSSFLMRLAWPGEGDSEPPQPDPNELANWQTVRVVAFNEFIP